MNKLSHDELLKKFDKVAPFSEDLAWVIHNGDHFHIHPDGTPAYEERFASAESFKDGVAWVMKKGGGRFAIHKDGSRVNQAAA